MNSNKNSYLNCTGKSAQTDSKSILDVLTGMNYGEFFEKSLFECFFENDFFFTHDILEVCHSIFPYCDWYFHFGVACIVQDSIMFKGHFIRHVLSGV